MAATPSPVRSPLTSGIQLDYADFSTATQHCHTDYPNRISAQIPLDCQPFQKLLYSCRRANMWVESTSNDAWNMYKATLKESFASDTVRRTIQQRGMHFIVLLVSSRFHNVQVMRGTSIPERTLYLCYLRLSNSCSLLNIRTTREIVAIAMRIPLSCLRQPILHKRLDIADWYAIEEAWSLQSRFKHEFALVAVTVDNQEIIWHPVTIRLFVQFPAFVRTVRFMSGAPRRECWLKMRCLPDYYILILHCSEC
jgi:hypothetical protein